MVSNIRIGQPATLNKCGRGGRMEVGWEEEKYWRASFFLRRWQASFSFFLSLLAGSEPVLRTNKQSKEAN